MKEAYRTPLTGRELMELDDRQVVSEDGRPWGKVNENAFTFVSDSAPTIEAGDAPGTYVLRSAAPVALVMHVRDEARAAAKVFERTIAERLDSRAVRYRDGIKIAQLVKRQTSVDGYWPKGIPAAYIPRIVDNLGSAQIGISARGTKVLLSTIVVTTEDSEGHSTVIDGESRQTLRPTEYPYTAVCKLELWTADSSGAWSNSGQYASGFMVGRRTLMTSGHSFEGATGTFAIRVIPACWANSPVFGLGFITWVVRRRWWHSDSGNDLQLCQLADPVGDAVGFFGASTYDSDWEGHSYWTMAGFPYDRSKYGMSVQFGIRVRDDDDGDDIDLDGRTLDTTQVENDADEASGASGSPLFAWFGAGIVRAIGVHSGTQTDWEVTGNQTWSCAAGGEGFVEIVRWGRANWD